MENNTQTFSLTHSKTKYKSTKTCLHQKYQISCKWKSENNHEHKFSIAKLIYLNGYPQCPSDWIKIELLTMAVNYIYSLLIC